jgi:hypothetical protein
VQEHDDSSRVAVPLEIGGQPLDLRGREPGEEYGAPSRIGVEPLLGIERDEVIARASKP